VTEFGDFDPEDAYDAGDPLRLRVAVLRRIVEHLRDEPDPARRERRRLDALRLLDNLDDETAGLVPALDDIRRDLGEL
jgi:hypothetical protein